MGYGLQHPFYIGLDMWIFSVGGHSEGRKDHKKADSPPPPSSVAQQIQFGNPPPLLDLINRHSLVIFLLVCSVLNSITYLLITYTPELDAFYVGNYS